MYTLSEAIEKDIDINKITDVYDVRDPKAKEFIEFFASRTRKFQKFCGLKWKIYGMRHAEYPIAIHNARFQNGPERPHVLDAGFNPWFDYYVANYHNCRVAACDIDYTPAFRKAIEGFKLRGLDVYPVVAKIQDLDIANNTFDRIFCISVLEHVPFDDRPVCMQKFIDLTKPGGRIVITVDTGTVYQEVLGTQAYKPRQVYPHLIRPFLDQVEIGDFNFGWSAKREYIRVKQLGSLSPAVFVLTKK